MSERPIQKHATFVQVDLSACPLPEMLGLCTEFAALALVPGAPRTRAVYQKSEAELRSAGVDARCFESESLAAQWLGGSAAA